ncbi:hypothetical protein F5Y14DRAFT_412367 [Nemania sp. NC0429]|nr:hypothetical protein F5Y14DRAFT_412367 [Nemania sp. NC0429]
MAEKYIMRVTTGSDYDINGHVVVPVNSHETVHVSSALIDAELNVRVQNYSGLPRNSPRTSPYFSLEPHDRNDDQYSIAIRFTLKQPGKARRRGGPSSGSESKFESESGSRSRRGQAGRGPAPDHSREAGEDDDASSQDQDTGVSGHDLQFGNDLDRPIRDHLPPGFSYALNMVKWWIDPGLEGDPYADEPYLYGPGLSSFNVVHVGKGDYDANNANEPNDPDNNNGGAGLLFDEGGDDEGLRARRALGVPDAAADRRKWALQDRNRQSWEFCYGTSYCVDFFNPYLDFAGLALRLPGFSLPVVRYWDGQGLRYVLRNRATGDVYLVIVFSLYLKEDVNEDGSLKPAALETRLGDRGVAGEEADKIEAGGGEREHDKEEVGVGEGEAGYSDDVD